MTDKPQRSELDKARDAAAAHRETARGHFHQALHDLLANNLRASRSYARLAIKEMQAAERVQTTVKRAIREQDTPVRVPPLTRNTDGSTNYDIEPRLAADERL